METKLLVAKEVAVLLRVDAQRVYELTRADKLPGIIRLGLKQYRYSRQAIEDFLHGSGNKQNGGKK